MKIFWFSEYFFKKKLGFLCFFGYLFFKFLKNKSQKLSMLEQKQGQIWNLHCIPHKVMNPNIQFSFNYSHDWRSSNTNIYIFSKNTDFFVWLRKIENLASKL